MKKFKKPLNRVSCDQCEQTFCSNHSLKTHIRTVHENIKDFSCNVCSMEFSTVSGVKRHLLTHHDITDTKVTLYSLRLTDSFNLKAAKFLADFI